MNVLILLWFSISKKWFEHCLSLDASHRLETIVPAKSVLTLSHGKLSEPITMNRDASRLLWQNSAEYCNTMTTTGIGHSSI
jgi:ABC-type transport system involved in Fe-S cluster assembly fused permease/ATPase subunit